jgi:hypothetical protein
LDHYLKTTTHILDKQSHTSCVAYLFELKIQKQHKLWLETESQKNLAELQL